MLILKPVFALVAVLAAVDSGLAAHVGQTILSDATSRGCCAAPADAQGFEELTTHLNQLDALARRFSGIAGIQLPNR
ncbi:MAG: hypothetical protein ABIN79_08470 [Marmoricola sp.]